ncbi:hypothetical protein F441_10836 [Phytophthora nicotianae CJ01A1]|uniref:Uncharacterized protein n=4 Tax=Phytophthora nicotianae TaxID=4792 RepID=V9F0Y6_PHYNI|nr:hypothetical protein F443_10912 [Phytophthora nicotianae P1569]ETK84388.1 hypothetical protein L915_10649 [Phytophthora nicotianae]ETO73065.1 hypothetical protein F444_10972 [Phytophthora nicotianae P1976]ETP14248.1 hypothetical protein F441_10836 [Phytophthora nicotianae CJ01A1]ETL37829.1 hypothetical protein L916_10538 [Phytophthora nicotianae]
MQQSAKLAEFSFELDVHPNDDAEYLLSGDSTSSAKLPS